ncbi:hypothetical protein ZIOFF_035674 [Zingiber officinale]|uniref:Legumain prodomain domain-containing protein n=1 Tax=Zingiber officinale TaxID=94328 RepID=A0A8J5GHI1_ZINOF|nr:hypothetical protein ZIOFF_035674 [Zingiber officinale]
MEYDDNRYNSSRGAHLNLKCAEKARILVNKIPVAACDLLIIVYVYVPYLTILMTCLETSENHNLKEETVGKQYESVKMRTSNQNIYCAGSHVMEYSDKNVKPEKLYLYQGFDPANANLTENALRLSKQMGVINQRDADLLFLWHMYERLEEGSNKKKEILSEITEMMMHRAHLDSSIELNDNLIFGSDVAPSVLKIMRPSVQALVDDWVCLKIVVNIVL